MIPKAFERGMRSRRMWAAVFGFLGALTLRVSGLDYGLPHLYHQDEPILMNHAMALAVSGPNPHFLVLPSFTIYFVFFIQAALYLLGELAGRWAGPEAFGIAFLADPGAAYWAGRFFLGALPGALSVGVIALTAKKLGLGRVSTAFAALALALAPFHVQHSHYLYTDTLLTLALLLLTLIGVSARNSAWIGWVVLGWAVSIKYTAAYVGPVWLAWFFTSVRRSEGLQPAVRKTFFGSMMAGIIFFLLSPFTLIDGADFLRQITHQAGAEGGVGWTHHLRYSLREGLGEPLLILALIGLTPLCWSLQLFRPPPSALRPPWKWIAAMLGVFYAVNACFGQHFARYILPAVPWVILLAAKGFEVLRRAGSKGPRALGWALAAAFLASACFWDAKILNLLSQKDTRTLAREWIHAKIPSGETIVMDHRFFGPRLFPGPGAIREKLAEAARRGLSAPKIRRAELELRADRREPQYRIWIFKENAETAEDFLFHGPFLEPDNAAVTHAGVRWVVTNDADADAATRRWEESLRKDRKPVQVFSPFRGIRVPPDVWASTAMPHRRAELAARERLGPYIEIWDLTDSQTP